VLFVQKSSPTEHFEEVKTLFIVPKKETLQWKFMKTDFQNYDNIKIDPLNLNKREKQKVLMTRYKKKKSISTTCK